MHLSKRAALPARASYPILILNKNPCDGILLDCIPKNGHIPRPKGRPRKTEATEEVRKNNELVQLRMQVELLRNFLSEVGRR